MVYHSLLLYLHDEIQKFGMFQPLRSLIVFLNQSSAYSSSVIPVTQVYEWIFAIFITMN